ncbi:TadG family pilus assembly protein [Xanthomonas massiliensis]|uniref:TadG family pilus assembly protein n=1 Tax=Xanthomonas massiliensis TaxID=1720302 RepID=UPI00098FB523|nr:TadG family pilus assembly protein [Xanthomonas massiliensis]
MRQPRTPYAFQQRRHAGKPGLRAQRGSMAVTIMLVMLGLVAILGLIEVGYLYWAKRDAQKVADLAALAGAQRLDLCEASDNAAARGNALQDNRFTGQLEIACGNWDPANAGERHFVAAGNPVNAVRVVARRTAIPFLGQAFDGALAVSGEAVASQGLPTASFSIGSRLLGINGEAPLQLLLETVGLDLSDTQVLGVQGLAKATITPSGLLDFLGIPIGTDITVGGLKALLEGRTITVTELLQLYDVALADQGGLVGLNLAFLPDYVRNAKIGTGEPLGEVSVNLLDILNLDLPGTEKDAGLDLDAQISALDLLTAAISVAGQGHAVLVDNLAITPGVVVKASITEPASVGFGPVGAKAYNAQIRLSVDIDSDAIPGLGDLLKLTKTRLHLPLYVDTVSAEATLTDIDCDAAPKTATFSVDSKIAGICLGKVTSPWQSTQQDIAGLCEDDQVLSLFGGPGLTTSLKLPALEYVQATPPIAEGETYTTRPNPVLLGTTVSALTNGIFKILDDLVSGLLSPNAQGGTEQAKAFAKQYLDATALPGGLYDMNKAIDALKNGYGDLPALEKSDWDTDIPSCDFVLTGICIGTKKGSVWTGIKIDICGTGLLGGLVTCVLGNAVEGVAGNINGKVLDAFGKYLATYPGTLASNQPYNPSAPACTNLLCYVLKPIIDLALKPLLDWVGEGLLTPILSKVLGLNLGESDVYVESIQCHAARLVY